MAFLCALVSLADNMVCPPFMLRLSCRARPGRPRQSRAAKPGEAFTLDKGVQWECRQGSPLSWGPCPKGILYGASAPKYIYTELGIGYRMLED